MYTPKAPNPVPAPESAAEIEKPKAEELSASTFAMTSGSLSEDKTRRNLIVGVMGAACLILLTMHFASRPNNTPSGRLATLSQQLSRADAPGKGRTPSGEPSENLRTSVSANHDLSEAPPTQQQAVSTPFASSAPDLERKRNQTKVKTQPRETQNSNEQRSLPQRIGGSVMEAHLVRKVQPLYPDVAKSARVQGPVVFTATISRDGHVESLQLLLVPTCIN